LFFFYFAFGQKHKNHISNCCHSMSELSDLEQYVASCKEMDRNAVMKLCMSKGMTEITAKTRPKNRLIEYLVEVFQKELKESSPTNNSQYSNNEENHIGEYQSLLPVHASENDNSSSFDEKEEEQLNIAYKPSIRPAVSVGDFIQSLQETYDLKRNEALHHVKLVTIMSQQQELLALMKSVEELQEGSMSDILDELCFDEEDRKYLPLGQVEKNNPQNNKQNALVQLCTLQQQIVTHLEHIVMRRAAKFRAADINVTSEKDLCFKEELLQKLCSTEKKKRQFIESTILSGTIKHTMFVEARLILLASSQKTRKR
jgi:hypothetical protein